jgi:hypothetical protein
MAAAVGNPASATRTALNPVFVPTDPALRGEFTPERYSPTVYTDADGGPAVNSAIAAAVAAGGGTIVISKPITFSTPLSATGLAIPLHFRGVGGATTISGKQSSLTYTGTGATTAFDCSNSTGLGFSDLHLTYNSGTFTGRLLDLAGGATRDGSLHKLRNMLIRPASTFDSHAALVYLDKSTSIDFDGCVLIGSKALYGKATNGSYSNRVTFRGGYLQGRTVEPVWNPDMNWLFEGVTFEPLTSGLAGAIKSDAGVRSRGIAIYGGYLADDSATTAAAWITHEGGALTISGGATISALATGGTFVKVVGTSSGPVLINGCTTNLIVGGFLVDLTGATTPKPVLIDGNNHIVTPTALLNGSAPAGSSYRYVNGALAINSQVSIGAGAVAPSVDLDVSGGAADTSMAVRTTSGANFRITSSNVAATGVTIQTMNGAPVALKANGNNGATVTTAGSTLLAKSAPATTATDGFPYIPAQAGAPTGVPTAQAGYAPMYYDTTNHKIWIYDAGWKGVVVA